MLQVVDSETTQLIAAANASTGRDGDALAAVWRAAVAAGKVNAELAAPLMERLWFTVWQGDPGERVRAREARWMAPLQREERVVGGHRVVTYVGGDGPAVLLVHGWGDYAARLGAFVGPLLDLGLRVVTVDMPAHGESPAHTTNVYEMADVARALIDEYDVRAMVAHSIGGMTAVFAALAAEEPPALALLAPAVRLEHALETFSQMFQLPPAAMDALRRRIEELFGPEVWTALHTDVLARALDVPALVIHDRDDDQVDVGDGRLLAAALPRAEMVETTGISHAKIIRDDAVVQRVVDFVSAAVAEDATPAAHAVAR